MCQVWELLSSSHPGPSSLASLLWPVGRLLSSICLFVLPFAFPSLHLLCLATLPTDDIVTLILSMPH